MGELLALIAAFGYTTQLILIRLGSEEQRRNNAMTVQLIILTTAFILLTAIFGGNILFVPNSGLIEQFRSLTLLAFSYIALEGLLGPLGGLFFLTKATDLIGPSKTSILRGCNPFFTTIFAIIFLGETPGIKGIFAVLLLILGIFIISYKKEKTPVSSEATKEQAVGLILGLMGGLAFSMAQTARGLALDAGATPNTVIYLGHITSLVVLLIIYRIYARKINFLQYVAFRQIKLYTLAGVSVVTANYALLSSFLLIPVWQAVAIRNLQPLLAIILSWLFLKKEELGLRIFIGAIIVVIGIWLTLI